MADIVRDDSVIQRIQTIKSLSFQRLLESWWEPCEYPELEKHLLFMELRFRLDYRQQHPREEWINDLYFS